VTQEVGYKPFVALKASNSAISGRSCLVFEGGKLSHQMNVAATTKRRNTVAMLRRFIGTRIVM
jgi:hypothetical protein